VRGRCFQRAVAHRAVVPAGTNFSGLLGSPSTTRGEVDEKTHHRSEPTRQADDGALLLFRAETGRRPVGLSQKIASPGVRTGVAIERAKVIERDHEWIAPTDLLRTVNGCLRRDGEGTILLFHRVS
jgi:hypothetical protein